MKNDFLRITTPGASHRLVLLHGWGADANDLLPLGEEIIRISSKDIELISLQAPQEHPEGLGRQWYGLFPPEWDEVPSAIFDLKSRLKELSTNQIPLQKTVLLGFSQGGAMAIASGCDLPMAGLIGCSGYSHPNWNLPPTRPPIFLSHGKQDEVVPYLASEMLFNSLKTIHSDCEIDLFLFQGGHQIPQELIPRIHQALESWLF